MAKSKTIKIGIDLGTTNSAITYNNDGNYDVIETDFQNYTPSIFGYNKGGDEVIGKKAYDELFRISRKGDPENYKAEVKRLMGTGEKTYFERGNVSLLPEEISAKILSYLKNSLLMKYPDADTESVVISVPAFFTTTQSEATKRAGKLAGFKNVVLIQEPIAGAIAYGFDNKKNENWLVYDLGGGTFDVAIISCQDGVLTVKGHAGDNFLGGKDIDNLIISKIILPKLSEDYSFSSINNLNKQSYCILKGLAEEAKKALTISSSTKILIEEDSIKDDDGNSINKDVIITLSKDEFEELIADMIDKTISLCKKAINDSGMESENIDKVIFVGGSTQIPLVRDKIKELGLDIDTSVNPLTVVSKGACIFGSTQIVKEEKGASQSNDKSTKFEIELNYDPVISDDDTSISGEIKGLGNDKNYYIQIQDSKQNYSSEKIKLDDGKFFIDAIPVVEKDANEFYIYLSDETGTILELTTDSFVIMKGGISIAGAPLSRSVYISLNRRNNVGELEDYCELMIEKGVTLPHQKTVTYQTSRDLKKDDTGNILPLRVYEGDGDSLKPERNILVCDINISPKDIPYNLPKGSDVEITVKKDISGEITLSAYFPDFDYYIEEVSRTTYDEEVNMETLYKDFDILSERYRQLSKHLSEEDKKQIRLNMSEIGEGIDNDDEDSKKKNQKEIRETMNLLDKVEANSQPEMVKEKYQWRLEDAKRFAKDFKEEENYLERIKELEKEGNDCIYEQNWPKLSYISDELKEIVISLLYDTSLGLKYMIDYLYRRKGESMDITKTNQIYNEAGEYMDNDDIDGMRMCVFKLWSLMPDTSNGKLPFSGISKK